MALGGPPPLAAALLYTGHLANAQLLPQARAKVSERALERLRHLEKLIRDMLLFARGETLGREPFPICDLVAELAHTLEPVARAKGIALAVECDCGRTEVVGDRKAVAGALTNLLENAVRHAPARTRVQLSVRQRGAMIELCVSDRGAGVSEQPDRTERVMRR